MALPPSASDAIAALAEGPRETVGRRLAEIVVTLLETTFQHFLAEPLTAP